MAMPTTVTVTPDLPGEPTGNIVIVEPGGSHHIEQIFTGPRLVTLTVTPNGRVVFSVASPPPPSPATS